MRGYREIVSIRKFKRSCSLTLRLETWAHHKMKWFNFSLNAENVLSFWFHVGYPFFFYPPSPKVIYLGGWGGGNKDTNKTKNLKFERTEIRLIHLLPDPPPNPPRFFPGAPKARVKATKFGDIVKATKFGDMARSEQAVFEISFTYLSLSPRLPQSLPWGAGGGGRRKGMRNS